VNVVANTSPLSYLLLIENVAILPSLFGRVHIPEAVRDELSSPRSPAPLRAWIEEPPQWLQIHRVSSADSTALSQLHAGEREAIILAEESGADLIILDEKAARQVATRRGLRVTGLLGLLAEAADRELLDLPAVIERLRQTNFRASPRLLKSLLDRRR
jgi:predicted nucleic acid-binding protein